MPPVKLRDQGRDHLLGQVHQVLIGCIGLVEFEHREFRVVPYGDALVPEVPVDLEDPLEPSHDEPLQVKLGGNPQVKVETEGVVVRLEGLRRRAAGRYLHHRRLDLDEGAARQEGPYQFNDPRPPQEDLPHVLVDDKVYVAPAVPLLNVAQAVPLLGQGAQRFRKQAHGFRDNGQLAGLRLENLSLDRHDVAHVEFLEQARSRGT